MVIHNMDGGIDFKNLISLTRENIKKIDSDADREALLQHLPTFDRETIEEEMIDGLDEGEITKEKWEGLLSLKNALEKKAYWKKRTII